MDHAVDFGGASCVNCDEGLMLPQVIQIDRVAAKAKEEKS
jgi:hypothetical protein